MALNAAQRSARRNRIGSSDAAAILGLDPYRTRSVVFAEKTGKAESFAGNDATFRGECLEPGIRKWVSSILGKDVSGGRMIVHPSDLLVANLDGAIYEGDNIDQIVEIKTSNATDEYGAEGTDEIPERVLIQVSHQLACVPEARRCIVAALCPDFGRFNLNLYVVNRNEELCAAVVKSGIDFMQQHVLPGIEPDNFTLPLEVVKRFHREPKKSIELPDPSLFEVWQEAKAAAKKAGEIEDQALADLLAVMDDAEAAQIPGYGTFTYFEQSRTNFDAKRFKLDQPETFSKYASTSTYRVARFKEAKEPALAMA